MLRDRLERFAWVFYNDGSLSLSIYFVAMSSKSPLLSGVVGGIAGAILTCGVLVASVVRYPQTVAWLLRQSSTSPVAASVSPLSLVGDAGDVVAKVNPAVVSIVISKDVPVMEQYFTNPFGAQMPGFSIPQYRQNGTQKQEVGGGSGFLISTDGYVVTNAHVVSEKTAEYTVFANDGKKFTAKIIAADPTLDIALIKIEGTDLPFLTFGDSSKLRLGQSVIAIGNALGEFRNTVSSGVVSGLARSITASSGNNGQSEALENVIQTDAAINPGNSGGPLIDLAGEVIGVNVATANGAQSIGFSLPANAVKDAVESIKKNGRVVRAFLGVRSIPVTAGLKEKNNLSVDYGALVVRGAQDELAVMPGSPADKAGILENDILLQIDGQKIDDTHSIASLIRGKHVGDKITIKLQRKGDEKTLEATLGEAK